MPSRSTRPKQILIVKVCSQPNVSWKLSSKQFISIQVSHSHATFMRSSRVCLLFSFDSISKNSLSDACASVTSLNIRRNSLHPHHLPELQERLCKFPSIEKLDLSFNPALGCKGVVTLLTSLSGARLSLRYCIAISSLFHRKSSIQNQGFKHFVYWH
jgi:hypothetical protein